MTKLTSENISARSAQAKLASRNDIVSFVKKTHFDDQIKKLNKNTTSDKNELNELSKKLRQYQQKY